MTNIAVDTFSRSNQSGFGTASDGVNTWGSVIGFGATSISGNEGILNSGSVADAQVVCGSHNSTTDINMLIRTSTSDTGNLNGLLWRWTTGTSNGYRCGFFSGTSFNVDKYTGGSRSNITSGSVSGGYNANEFWWIRLIHTSGGTLQIRWWKDGTSEPSNFTGFISISETSYSNGDFGVSAFLNGAVSSIKYDSMTVTDNQSITTSTRTITATAALLATKTRTISATAALLATKTRTINASTALLQTKTRTIPDSAALLATKTRSIPSTSALLATKNRTIPATSALLQTNERTIGSTAALLATKQRTISASSALLLTSTRTISVHTALLATGKRTIAASVTLAKGRYIPCSVSLSSSAFLANTTLIIPSGSATLVVKSGQATLIV